MSPHTEESVARLTDAARRVVNAVVLAGPDAADATALAATLNAVAEELERRAPSREERMRRMWAPLDSRPHNLVDGPENPLAPPLRIDREQDDSVRARAVFGLPYQGPPGFLHGGVSALVMDHVLGLATIWAGDTGMTARLTLDFRRPVPLFEQVDVTARQVGVDGRKIRATGTISAGGTDCVVAEGLFVTPRPA
ncbi:PaaI family thioesterase [Actinosynnema sp. NPDC020468]|uniref:PaaI family thioesterase n=1 Tax=Actinosynnema sp. NPDC020468 TaxID=3154488 RepID=UPI0033D361EA